MALRRRLRPRPAPHCATPMSDLPGARPPPAARHGLGVTSLAKIRIKSVYMLETLFSAFAQFFNLFKRLFD
jgi:hypothetical protein